MNKDRIIICLVLVASFASLIIISGIDCSLTEEWLTLCIFIRVVGTAIPTMLIIVFILVMIKKYRQRFSN